MTSPDPATAADPAPPRPRTRWWQRLLLVGFAFVVLAAIEGVLRLARYGPDTRFVAMRLVRDDGTRVMGINPEAYRRFHFRPLGLDPRRTWFAPWREFAAPKEPDTFRVFFLGGSSVEGYPHPPNACAPAFLEVLLGDAMPDRRVEVVNGGVTAINSFSLREWAPAVLDQGADALVVYAGHNEFYGAYGAGSTSSIGTRRSLVLAHLALRRLRLAQVVTDLVNGISSIGSKTDGNLMERLAHERSIPIDDPRYAACRANFAANLADIVRAARAGDVPIYLCGLVGNERDLVPLAPVAAADLNEEDRHAFEAAIATGTAHAANGDWTGALPWFEEACRIDPGHAGAVYRVARCRDRLGDIAAAHDLYREARDLDALRFRATAEFTDVIREVCAAEGATWVDVPAAFAAASDPPGLIGRDLVCDHLHPTILGHYLLARAVADAMAPDLGMDAGSVAWPSYDRAAARLGIDEIDEINGRITIYLLSGGFPFAGTGNDAWRRDMEREILAWQNSLTGALKEGHHAWSTTPRLDTLHYHVGEACLARDEFDRAIGWFLAAETRSEPHGEAAARARVGIARCAAEANAADAGARIDEALAYLDDCIAMHPGDDARPFRRLRTEVETLR